jgi:hypothetical protein
LILHVADLPPDRESLEVGGIPAALFGDLGGPGLGQPKVKPFVS